MKMKTPSGSENTNPVKASFKRRNIADSVETDRSRSKEIFVAAAGIAKVRTKLAPGFIGW